VLYDFLKNEWVDWGKILTNFSRQFLKITKSKGDATNISRPKCLIIDYTLLCKTGKTIEHIGKVFDHCSRTYQLGMEALVCGLWDEISFIPTTFSVHNEPGKNRNRGLKNKELAYQFYKERDLESPCFQQVKQLSTEKISMAIQMVKNAFKTGFEPAYVLADYLFMCDTFVSEIQKIKIRYVKKLHVIGLIKTSRCINHDQR
jgi:hypothetical protein